MFTGSLVALITPMHNDGSVDYTSLTRLIDWHVGQGTNGLVILGTTGEAPTLNEDERNQIIQTTVEHVNKRIPVIVGTGSNATDKTCAWTQKAAQLGTDAALVVLPYYNRPTEAGMVKHFEALAALTDLPILLYNVPKRTGCDISNQTVIDLLKAGIVHGVKDATGDLRRISIIRDACPNACLLSGDDPSANAFMQAGGNGVITVAGNVAPAQLHQLCQAASNNQPEQANQINATLEPLFEAMALETNPIPAKWAVSRLHELEDGIRLPLTPLSGDFHATINQVLETIAP